MKWLGKDPSIVFSDNHVLVAFKPAGMLTQPDNTGGESLEEFAKAWVKQEYQKAGNVYLHAVHRLDKPVSGLVLFARTSKALSRLNEAVRNQEIERFYLAEVEGKVAPASGRLEHMLVHDEHRATVRPDGKKAVLFYEVVRVDAHSSQLRVRLETGRYHQIRAQLGAIGHPIVGDSKYGAKTKSDTIHLCCIELVFKHPVSHAPTRFTYE